MPKIEKHFASIGKSEELAANWREAWRMYNEEAEAKSKEKSKKAKVRNITRNVACAIVTSGLEERGLQYAIEQYEYRMVVYVSIQKKWQVEFSIVYSKFEVESFSLFENIEKLIEIQSSNTPFCKLQKMNRRIKWMNAN